MGWLFGHYTRASLVEHLKNGNVVKTLKNCFVGNNMWAVQEYTRTHEPVVRFTKLGLRVVETETTVRFICLYMLRGCPQVKHDPCNWGYKDVSEDMGPYQLSCPLSYIEMVEAWEKEHGIECFGHAKDWRESVREHLARKHRKLAKGTKIRLYDREYVVLADMGRKGYRVEGAEYGFIYLLKPSQIAAVEVLL